jgi:predicted NUDIX family NTP pyrophosphohydrolase
MQKTSGGLLLYREDNRSDELRVLVAHPGGPFFANKDDGWWSIPKGEPDPGEDIFHAALREFEEETGEKSNGPYIDLGSIVQKNGKEVFAWAFAGDWEDGKVPRCNEISMEYPKGSGKQWTFPEIDRALLLPIPEAKIKLRPEQAVLVDRLVKRLPQAKLARASKG